MKNPKEQFEKVIRLRWLPPRKLRSSLLSGVLALLLLSVVNLLGNSGSLMASGMTFQGDQEDGDPFLGIEIGAGLKMLPFNPADVEEFEVDGNTATLKTDPELESTLQKAERYRDDGNYSFACKLWQLVLENSGDTLYSKDNEHYFSSVSYTHLTLPTIYSV